MKKALSIFFALGLALGITGQTMGENRLIPLGGISQGTADGLYGSLAGEAGWAGTQDYSSAILVAGLAAAANQVMTQAATDARHPQLAAATNTFTGVQLLPDGTSSDPSLAFASETGTGLVLSKAGRIGIAIDGTGLVMTVDGTIFAYDGTTANFANATAFGFAASDFTFDFSANPTNVTFDLKGATGGDFTVLGDAVFDDAFEIASTSGVDIAPGAGVDTDLIEVSIGGTPELRWVNATQKFEFTRGVIQPDSKAGTVAGASFAGNPKVFTVTFGTAFPDTNYAVSIAGEDNRTFTYQTKLAAGFIINSNANLAFTGDVDWTATAHSDP